MRPMSTRCSNTARRSASIGIRLWPPASTFAPVAELGEQLRGLGGRVRRVVLERAGFTGASTLRCAAQASFAAQPPSTGMIAPLT